MLEVFNPNMQNKKIVIYGVGRIFQQYKQIIEWNKVVAIIDSDIGKHKEIINGNRVETPERIRGLEYDFIVIFTDQYFEEVKVNLVGNFFVEEQKILSWRALLDEEENVSDCMAKFYTYFVQDVEAVSILDIGRQKLARCFFSNKWPQIEVSNFGLCKFQLYQTFYKEIFRSKVDIKYDVIFLWGDYEKDVDWNCLMAMSKKHIIWTISYGYRVHEDFAEKLQKLESWGRKKVFLFSHAIVYIFKKNAKEKEVDCSIFVVTHKQYNVLSNDIYKPVCVGNYIQESFYSEQSGDNIRYLNDRINECSALYWIWKNTNSKYVGLNHYRRYFFNNGIRNTANYLYADKIVKIFNGGFDIILPELTRLNVTVLESIRNSIGKSLCDEALQILFDFFESRDVLDMNSLEHVLLGNTFYKCNMFITKRSILNLYCEWLFSFLIEATERLNVSECDAHHKRTMGFFAEIMLTVWLLRQDVTIKELPVSEI